MFCFTIKGYKDFSENTLRYYKQVNKLVICVQKLQVEAYIFNKHDKHLKECCHKSNRIELLVVFNHITILSFRLQYYSSTSSGSYHCNL